jgi:molecular chaperone DnaK
VTYQVGIDLGTTFTAAAVHRDGRSSIFSLGSQAASIPSVVLLREDGTELTGEAAVRRALTEPERVAREFKRRLGDTTPIIVGGAPYSAEQLMARLLTATLREVEKREGAPPSRVAVTHPANWGPYKIDLLQQAVRLAGLDASSVDLLAEPQAAAIHYATHERVEVGTIVAVYDLGGGTFDAAVLRKTDTGFDIMGRPEGIERMGGIDFDAAVFAHVNRALDGKLQELDPDDPMVMSGVARLREDCVGAKVALSSDTDATIPVLLPNLQTDVRITRSEFESLIRPSLSDSIAAMHRALESAGITADDVGKVLLVGGSSRIPLIGQLVSSELGRPVAVDADPKHSIALGAATFAGGVAGAGDMDRGGGLGAAGAAAVAGAVGGAAVASAAEAGQVGAEPLPEIVEATQPMSVPIEPSMAPTAAMPMVPTNPTAQMPTTAPGAMPPPGAMAPGGAVPPGTATTPLDAGAGGQKSKTPLLVGGVLALLLIAVGAFVVLGGGGDDDTVTTPTDAPVATQPAETQPPETQPAETQPAETQPPETQPAETQPPETQPTEPPPPSDAELTSAVQAAVAAVSPAISASVTDAVATLSGQVDQTTADAAVAAAGSVEGITSVQSALDILEPDEVCTDEIQSEDRWACVVAATFDGTTVRAEFIDGGTSWEIAGNHLHFFADSTEPEAAGIDGVGVSTGGGLWEVWDESPFFEAPVSAFGGSIDRLCVRVALPDHSLESIDSGNCWPVEQLSGFRAPTAALPGSIGPATSGVERHLCTIPSATRLG